MSNSPSIYRQFTNWVKSKILSCSSSQSSYLVTQEQRELLLKEFSTLQKQNILLQQSLREQQTQAIAHTESLFLELLEVNDALEALINYLENNPEPSPEFFHRLPKSLGAVHRKFLSILNKHQVSPIELSGNRPDFNFCRVVDREIRDDVEDQTITQVVRSGFMMGEKVLRPTEVITAKVE